MKAILIAVAGTLLFGGYIIYLDSTQTVGEDPEPREEIRTEEQTLFIPSGYRRLPEENIIVLDVSVLPGTLNSIWAVYGKDTENLNAQTPPQSSELGMGTAGEYGRYSIIISPKELEPGISYFYRIAGETTDGEVLYSGLNSFTAGK